MLKLTVTGRPITKKNSQQIIPNRRTGRSIVLPSKQFKVYQKEFLRQTQKHRQKEPIDEPITLTACYYMPTRHKVDITNLMSATHDLLQDAAIIADDCMKIVKSVDGTRVYYDKENPRVEITITKYQEGNHEQTTSP